MTNLSILRYQSGIVITLLPPGRSNDSFVGSSRIANPLKVVQTSTFSLQACGFLDAKHSANEIQACFYCRDDSLAVWLRFRGETLFLLGTGVAVSYAWRAMKLFSGAQTPLKPTKQF